MEHGHIYNYWAGLDQSVRRRLLLGTTGSRHLLETGFAALESSPMLGVEMLFAAYAANPLDGNLARQLCNLGDIASLFPLPAQECLNAVKRNWSMPENISYFMRITSKRDNEKIRNYILSCLDKETENLFWLQQGMIHAGAASEYKFGLQILSRPHPESITPAIRLSKAMFHYMGREYDQCFTELVEAAKVFGSSNVAGLAASAALAKHERKTAIKILSDTVQEQPWRVSETLRLYDLVHKQDSNLKDFPGSLAILLYSYNKAEELDATLNSLHKSELYGADIYTLDNGSKDGTSAIIDKWQEQFGSRMHRIDLPVNVGAAAARNWLMNIPKVVEHDFALYLDDDVEVEPNWLSFLADAVRAYPDAGVWGCRVVDHASHFVIQSADLHIVQPAGEEGDGPELDLSKIAPNPFKVSDLHHQVLDAGYFDYIRPCASVTGCCHLFRTSKLLDNGGFSLFLSPSQYDDMEHDLRICLKGDFAVYQGLLRILHRKRTGTASRTDAIQEGNALGNKYKMQAMHPRSEILRIMSEEERLLQSDLIKKTQYLLDTGIIHEQE